MYWCTGIGADGNATGTDSAGIYTDDTGTGKNCPGTGTDGSENTGTDSTGTDYSTVPGVSQYMICEI